MPGATYTGRTATGATVRIDVARDGSAIVSYQFGNPDKSQVMVDTRCYRGRVEGKLHSVANNRETQRIASDGSFSFKQASDSNDPYRSEVAVKGKFSGDEVSGTFAWVFPDDPRCTTDEVSWSAKAEGR